MSVLFKAIGHLKDRGIPNFEPDLEVCAKGVNAVVAGGDSGGMLIVERDGRWYQIGVTSYINAGSIPELSAGDKTIFDI